MSGGRTRLRARLVRVAPTASVKNCSQHTLDVRPTAAGGVEDNEDRTKQELTTIAHRPANPEEPASECERTVDCNDAGQ
jgi:hypothetical protein